MRSVQRLLRPTVAHFRDAALSPQRPALLASFAGHGLDASTLPATSRWFETGQEPSLTRLNSRYFASHGQVNVPVEVTQATANGDQFRLEHMSLTDFVESSNAQTSSTNSDKDAHLEQARIYLAQCPVNLLPADLQSDVPTPDLVKSSGRGDVYESTVWIGPAPTYTPLHKDPNPNVLAQLAGLKTVRLLEPSLGLAFYQEAQRRLGRSGSPAIRGSEMMAGHEKDILDELVWRSDSLDVAQAIYEQALQPGDAIFIPQGWWHSVKGTGAGMTGSVNWWFR